MSISILVVEDDPTLLRTISRNLSVGGYEVTTAASVEEAVTLLQDRVPELLLVDIGLPDGSGWDVMRELRGMSGVDVPMVVMSVLELDAETVAHQRISDVIRKPFEMEALLGIVAHAAPETV